METKSKSTPLITYIHEISGQLRRQNIIESEHAYAKFWNRHPDPTNKSRPARFLFMQSFARWSTFETGESGDLIDVDGVDEKLFLTTSNPNLVNPLVAEVTALTKGQVTITEEFAITDSSPNKSTWSNLAQRIWAKALNILYTDRLIRLSIESTPNELITKKMISHKCANKFRHLFASLAFWDPSILSWLHGTLMEHVSGQYLIAYHESMQLLRARFPSIIDRFYLPPVHNDPIRSRNKGPMPDPIQNVLNNHKPKRIKNCPLFILVPNGPQQSNSIIPQRLKHWQLLFASLGKIITLSINYRPTMRVKDCLNEIMIGVRDKIAECRTTFTEGRPIILVGFGHSSLIATHVALDSTCKVTATICLGFPLAGVNGFRGDLDDPLLDTTVPTLFVIGQNATLSSIDDVEDFRERITKTETGLVVVGGANDHLVVSQTKQRFTGITQAIVDRCISDEIYDFINFVMNPHFVPSENNYVSAAAKNLSKTPPGDKGEKTTKSKSKSKSKTDKQTAKETSNNSSPGKSGQSSNLTDSSVDNGTGEVTTQSTVGVSPESKLMNPSSTTQTKPIGIDTSTNSSLNNTTDGHGDNVGVPSLDKSKVSTSAGASASGGGGVSGVNVDSSSGIGSLTQGIVEGVTPSTKSKPKAKKSRPKAKKKDESNKHLTGKDDKLDKEGKEITPIEDDKKESKQSKDLKENKESKQSKDKKEGDKESKESKTVKESKTSKEKEKENKKKDSGPMTSIACESLPPPIISSSMPLHRHHSHSHHHHQQQSPTTPTTLQPPPLPPPLLTASTHLESSFSSTSTSSSSLQPPPTLSTNFNSSHSNITQSPPPLQPHLPPLIIAPGNLIENTSSILGTSTGTNSSSLATGISTLPSKRKKISTSKFDPDGSQPAKKKREDPVMSISSIEKIERTLDEVIATSMLEFKPTTTTSPSPSSSSTTTSTTTSAIEQKTSTSIPIPITTPTPTPTSSIQHGSSYDVSEVIALPPCSSNTRTRTIRAPKQLDI